MELNAWTEGDIPRGCWRDGEAPRTSVRDLGRFREIIVAVRLTLLVGRSDRCVYSEGWVWSVERSNGG